MVLKNNEIKSRLFAKFGVNNVSFIQKHLMESIMSSTLAATERSMSRYKDMLDLKPENKTMVIQIRGFADAFSVRVDIP